jgi:hypothetical protein
MGQSRRPLNKQPGATVEMAGRHHQKRKTNMTTSNTAGQGQGQGQGISIADELEQRIIDAINEYGAIHPDTTRGDIMTALHYATVRIIVATSDDAAERAEVMCEMREALSGMAQDIEERAAFLNTMMGPSSDRVQ